MNRLEKLEAKYPHLTLNYTELLPSKYSGLCDGDVIHININLNNTNAKKLVVLSEEITHNEFGVGDITKQKTISDKKQEAFARKMGCLRIVVLDELVECYKKGILEVWEIAEELEVTDQCILDAMEYIKQTKGLHFFYKNRLVCFTSDSSLKVI